MRSRNNAGCLDQIKRAGPRFNRTCFQLPACICSLRSKPGLEEQELRLSQEKGSAASFWRSPRR